MPTEFGTRLSQLRKAKNLTQAQLCALAGISIRVLSYYENHARSISGILGLKLAQSLGVPISELLGPAPDPAPAPLPMPASEDLRLWRLFQKVRKLPEKDQRAVFRLVNSLCGLRDEPQAV